MKNGTSQELSDQVLIEAEGISVVIDGRRILDHVNLTLTRGEIVTLVGLNGCGKTTLARALLGLVALEEGRIRRAAGLRIGYAPQIFRPDLALPLSVRRFLSLGTRADDEAIEQCLSEVGASAIADARVPTLSGGERHRVLLARALLRQPDLLVLDEPMAGVDMVGQSELYGLIARIRDRYGCGVLLVSHDLHLVMAGTDRVVCLNHHICCAGSPSSVIENPAFVSLFGTRVAASLAVYSHHHDHRHDALGAVIGAATGDVSERVDAG